jgi:outer membrane lipopolysaccharide assembly protein LptE/RlpB
MSRGVSRRSESSSALAAITSLRALSGCGCALRAVAQAKEELPEKMVSPAITESSSSRVRALRASVIVAFGASVSAH